MSQPPSKALQRPELQSRLRKIFLYGALLAAALTTIPRLMPGYPGGVDSSSHLYKVIFIHDSLKTSGNIPFWSPDWYAGTPSLLLYPPISYLAAAGIGLAGFGPVLGYKVVEFLAYVAAPVGIYVLAKEFGFDDHESALAALFFVVVPEVIENFLFYDRFPNLVALPIFSVFTISFMRLMAGSRKTFYAGASALLLGALILTHQLTAMVAILTAIVLVVTKTVTNKKITETLTWPLASIVLGLAVAAVWLVPFLATTGEFSANPFFNRNVEVDVFIRFSYFGFDIASYLLGIAQFVLAALATQSIVGRAFGSKAKFSPKLFFPVLLAAMSLYEFGQSYSLLQSISVSFLVAAFIALLVQLALNGRELINGSVFRELALLTWFFVLFWLGLGSYALPFVKLPILGDLWKRMVDVYRFWLFLAVPMVVLAARGTRRSITRIWLRRTWLVPVLVILIVLPIGLSVYWRIDYSLTGPIRKSVLEYTAANTEIPPKILSYFSNEPWDGRILAINAPLWIYVLPALVGKPIVDGWFPQSKLVKPLVTIDDYRLNDLETRANDTERIREWKKLVQMSDLLAINWLIIGEGNSTTRDQLIRRILVDGAGFELTLKVPYQGKQLYIYRAAERHEMVSVSPSQAGTVGYERSNPDVIELNVSGLSRPARILVKEAYFPTWSAESDGSSLKVEEDKETRMITFNAPAGAKRITLFQRAEWPIGQYTSIVAIVLALVLIVRPKIEAGMKARR